jgi:hypothetical protein
MRLSSNGQTSDESDVHPVGGQVQRFWLFRHDGSMAPVINGSIADGGSGELLVGVWDRDDDRSRDDLPQRPNVVGADQPPITPIRSMSK